MTKLLFKVGCLFYLAYVFGFVMKFITSDKTHIAYPGDEFIAGMEFLMSGIKWGNTFMVFAFISFALSFLQRTFRNQIRGYK